MHVSEGIEIKKPPNFHLRASGFDGGASSPEASGEPGTIAFSGFHEVYQDSQLFSY